ncbi:PHD finger protein At2g01810-like [Andrographis paniculata]|uniref:PHD finger protein At2g01810-like n=1 Tax=Andrographis paniculata TaxID=175694 RepID=UPI0021E9545A|nr:PHD finger protein At2g01810-like [Andrographis paniculata]
MASIVFNKNNKRKNRINSENLFEFKNFAAPGSVDNPLPGAFRDNIRVFLQNSSEIEDYTVNGMLVWCTPCVAGDNGVFPLYTIEETVQNSAGQPFCSHCESAGWGHHFVCKRKYHFIIPAKEHWEEQLDWDLEEIRYHNLYGLIHCNGYGHLICVNGLKNNSRFFSADDSMRCWDYLCTVLKARSISACHATKREAIELSLFHGIAQGTPWFGKWGYKCVGGKCSEVKEGKYDAALEFLSSLSLEKLVRDFKNTRNMKRIIDLIETCRKFSGKPLVTLSDLLKYMLATESRTPSRDASIFTKTNSETKEIPMRFETFLGVMMRDCRWSAKRLEDVLFVIVDLLKQQKEDYGEMGRGMSRQELRDEARKSIGDTGLIDFVLKSIRCFAVGNQVITRAVNPSSRLTEFNIYEYSPETGAHLGLSLSEDLMFLYENVLELYPDTHVVTNSTFVKDWPIQRGIINYSMELLCKVLPTFDELETELNRRLPPGEIVVANPQMTISHLKMAAQWALRDTYCIMHDFMATQIGGLRKIEDEEVLNTIFEPGSLVWVRGTGLDLNTHLRYEDRGKKTSPW